LYEGSVPEKLVKAVARLKSQSAMQRPRLSPLLKCPVLDIPHCKSMEFLDEIAVKPAEEKISFYQSVPDQLARGIHKSGRSKVQTPSIYDAVIEIDYKQPTGCFPRHYP
jgi:hypothetical protein